MEAALLDLTLAIFHHLLAFSLGAIIAAELILLGGEPTARIVDRLVKIDRAYGVIAALILVIGAARLIWGLKGWEVYIYNWPFWGKMTVFLVVGLLSIAPTMRFIAWQRQARTNAAIRISDEDWRRVRRIVFLEAGLFACIPVLAAIMARVF